MDIWTEGSEAIAKYFPVCHLQLINNLNVIQTSSLDIMFFFTPTVEIILLLYLSEVKSILKKC